MRATATSEVTCGSKIPMRKNVRAWSLVFRRCAITSASRSCGMVERTQIPNVFSTAFQKYESWMRSAKLWSPMKWETGLSRFRSVSETYAV